MLLRPWLGSWFFRPLCWRGAGAIRSLLSTMYCGTPPDALPNGLDDFGRVCRCFSAPTPWEGLPGRLVRDAATAFGCLLLFPPATVVVLLLLLSLFFPPALADLAFFPPTRETERPEASASIAQRDESSKVLFSFSCCNLAWSEAICCRRAAMVRSLEEGAICSLGGERMGD
jgi:hypothetical protein